MKKRRVLTYLILAVLVISGTACGKKDTGVVIQTVGDAEDNKNTEDNTDKNTDNKEDNQTTESVNNTEETNENASSEQENSEESNNFQEQLQKDYQTDKEKIEFKGGWVTVNNDVFQFNEDSTFQAMLVSTNEMLDGTYETDNSTYIKLKYKKYSMAETSEKQEAQYKVDKDGNVVLEQEEIKEISKKYSITMDKTTGPDGNEYKSILLKSGKEEYSLIQYSSDSNK